MVSSTVGFLSRCVARRRRREIGFFTAGPDFFGVGRILCRVALGASGRESTEEVGRALVTVVASDSNDKRQELLSPRRVAQASVSQTLSYQSHIPVG